MRVWDKAGPLRFSKVGGTRGTRPTLLPVKCHGLTPRAEGSDWPLIAKGRSRKERLGRGRGRERSGMRFSLPRMAFLLSRAVIGEHNAAPRTQSGGVGGLACSMDRAGLDT
jgi:hypothetical protein